MGRNAGVVFAINWTNNVLRFLLGIYIVKVFGADGKGIYFLIQAGASATAVLFSMGLSNSLVYHLKKEKLSEKQAVPILIISGLATSVATLLLLLIFGVSAWNLLLKDIPCSWTWGLIVVAYVPILYFMLFFKAYLLANRDMKQYFVLTSLSLVCVLTTTVLATCYWPPSIQVVLLAAILIEGFAVMIFSWIIYRKKPSPGDPESLIGASIRDILSYGLRGHAGTVGTNLMSQIDAFLLAAFATTATVGYYSVAKVLFQALISIPRAINGLLMGVYCEINHHQAYRLNHKVTFAIGSAMLFVASIGFVLGGPFLIWVYGPEFAVAVLPLQILLGSAVLLGTSSPYTPLFLSQGRPGVVSIIGICAGLANIALAFFLISQYSIVGAAIASIATSLLTFLMRILYGSRLQNNYEKSLLLNPS